MSDTTVDNGLSADSGQRVDKKRILVSIATAVALHGLVLAVLALGIGIASGPAVTTPVTIELQSADGVDAAAGPGAASAAGGGDNGGATSVAAAAVSVPSPAAAAPPAAGGKGADASGFVIPTPRARPADATRSGSGPAFRETGGRTGAVQGIPSVPSPVTAPAVAPVQQGTGGGSAASSGSGASSTQRSGAGVLVTGSSGSTSSGKLDLSQLDKSLAGRGSTGAGKPGAGAGSGAAASSGSSGGAASGGAGSGAGTGGGQGYSVSWEGAGAGQGRKLLPPVILPKVPAWVGAQGLTLRVAMSFSVLPDGTVTAVSTQRSSGYADIDSAVVDALRQWRYSPSAGALLAKGTVSFDIRMH